MESHLLIIDDDERIRDLLQQYLRRNGFLVTVARDGAHSRRLLEFLIFDLIIMDIMMPGQDGISLTRDLCGIIETPILLLTARGETKDIIEGFEAGADDYLAKPFEPKELLLRITAILRRIPEKKDSETSPRILLLGASTFNVQTAELWGVDQQVRLTSTEVHLMRIFANRVDQPISRAELVAEMGRGQGQAQDRAIDVQITRLRRKIEPDPKQPRYLQTIRGEGYMLSTD